MDNKYIMEFLRDLERNNSLEWMHSNKSYYGEAKAEFISLVEELIKRVASFDSTVLDLNAKEIIFRLNRDTRFSQDKSPYNPAFRAHISRAKREPVPAGPYLNIKPGKCFLGGGLFAYVFKDATQMVREYLVEYPEGFLKIINNVEFKTNFIINGEKLKNVPKGYPKDHVLAEFLKHKSWDVEYNFKDELFEDAEKFLDFATDKFKLMQPINEYLNVALKDFKLPKRP